MARKDVRITYSEGLEVIDGEVIAKEVEEGILKHAAVAVAGDENCQFFFSLNELVASAAGSKTYERTKRSRFNQSGFLGLKVMNLLNRTWATGAMPLDKRVSIHVFCCRSSSATERRVGKLTWEHQGVPSCCGRSHQPVESSSVDIVLCFLLVMRATELPGTGRTR
jgi:hypothetical protein